MECLFLLWKYKGERNDLNNWAKEKGESEIKQYWKDRNQTSIDGLSTGIIK